MKKALTITIAGTLFTIEEDAYQKLDDYLKSINTYFGSFPDSKEIINDIEARIAEQLLDRNNKDAVVTIDDVQKLILVMGRVEDIAGESNSQSNSYSKQSESDTEYRGPRKLYRNPDDVWVMGLASGVAAYFDMDPIIARGIFVVLTFITGFVPGIILYFVLALLIPSAKSPAEKIQMRGGPVSLRSFKENMNEYAQNLKKDGKDFGDHLKDSSVEFANNIKEKSKHWQEQWENKEDQNKKDFFKQSSESRAEEKERPHGPGAFFRTLVRAIFKTIGFVIKMVATLCIILVVFVFIGLIFHFHAWQLPLGEVVSRPTYYGLITLFFLGAILPLSLLVLIGNVVMLRGTHDEFDSALGIIGTWFAVMLIIGAITLTYLPTLRNRIQALPEYQQTSEVKTVSDFSKLDVSGIDVVHITQATTTSVSLAGSKADINSLVLSVNESTLHIYRTDMGHICFFYCPQNGRVTLTITTPTLTNIDSSGATEISANVGTTTDFHVVESGISQIQLTGTTTSLYLDLSGASHFDGHAFLASTTSIEASGASHASVHSPKITKDLSGVSSIEQL